EDETARLLREAPRAYRTQINDLLLTALSRALCGWSAQTSVWVELEGHGREALGDADLSRTVGWFTSLYPVLLTPGAEVGGSIKAVKEQLRAVPRNGLGHGVLATLGADAVRAQLAAMPRPRVTFNYLGQLDGSFGEDGLFARAPESVGAGQDPTTPLQNWLTVNAEVSDAKLSLTLSYGRAMYRDETMQALGARLAAELRGLIAHCTTAARTATPSDFPLAGLTQAELAGLDLTGVEDLYPLSPLQTGLLFHALYTPDADVYVSQLSIEVTGLRVDAFAAAWREAIARHTVLRTSFVEVGDRWLQRVHERATLAVRELDARGREVDLVAIAADERTGFVLSEVPLLKLLLVRLGDGRHQLIWSHHHVLLDGWSAANLIGEVLRTYAGEQVGARGGKYRDYIAWLAARDAAASEAFWTPHLGALEEPTFLARALPRDGDARGHAELATRWGREETRALTAFAKRARVTVNTVVQGAWLLLLQRYTGQRAVAFGATVAGRPSEVPNAEHLLGLFINTVPVIQAPREHEPVGDFLRALQAYNAALREHEHVALSDLQRWAGTPGQALFDTILVFENYPVDQALRERGGADLQFGKVASVDRTNYALTLEVHVGTTLALSFSYLRDQLDDARVEALAGALDQLIEQLVRDEARPLGALRMLGDGARAEALSAAHGERNDGALAPLHRAFEAQVARTPQAFALTAGAERLRYAALNQRANRLARALVEAGVGPDVLVGVRAERAPALVVAVLAVLKAGGAYLPIDPETPHARALEMLTDAGAALLLNDDAGFADAPCPTWALREAEARAEANAEHDLRVDVSLDALAYCIFTSGSTGRPKGVANPHRGVANRLLALARTLPLGASDRLLQKTPFGFDVSVAELFWPLTRGAELVIAEPGAQRDPEALGRLVRAHRVTTIDFVPSMLQAFVAAGELARCPSLRVVTVGGEALAPELARAFADAHGAALVNMYGPTETAIDVAMQRVDARREPGAPIGRPLANLALYVLDDALEPVPSGVAGALYVGGPALARGYVGRAGATAAAFVPSPFDAPGARLYRTGDRVRRRDDGVLEFLGRVDAQIKLRGFRIELGEVEARLAGVAGVSEAAADVRPTPAGKQLVGYVVGAASIDEAALRDALRATLPEYMVPARIVALAALPRMPSGKLDRRALPVPDAVARGPRRGPESERERVLCAVWSEVLGIADVGVDDDFFELGGDSIISLQVVARARQRGLRVEPRQLFEHHTVRALAAVALEEAGTRIAQGPASGEARLTPVQRRFFDDPTPNRDHFNQSLLLSAREPLDAEALRAALAAVHAHHDGLRLRFDEVDGDVRQAYAPIAPVELLWVRDADGDVARTALCDEAQRSLSIGAGPLLRALLVRGAQGERLLLVIHHLVVDGVSWRVLLEDLETAYRQARAGGAIALPPKTSAFQAYTERLAAYAEGDEDELGYWTGLGARAANTGVPCDEPQGACTVAEQAEHFLKLSEDDTRALLREAPQAYRTQVNDLLLTALARALCRFSGRDAAWIEIEGHGREDCFEGLDVSRTVGWFTSLFPVLLTPAKGLAGRDLAASIKTVKEQLRAVPNHGLGFGALATMGDPFARRELAKLPRPRVTFNYLGQIDQAARPDDLFALAPEAVGESQDAGTPLANAIAINGEVAGGVLTLSFAYSRAQYRAETIARLVEDTQQELETLIGHCVHAEAPQATPSDFPLAGLAQADLDAFPVPLANVEDVYPLSPMQQGMLFHTLYSADGSLYVNQQSVRITGLDAARFAEAWEEVTARHTILRTGFVQGADKKRWLQVVHREVPAAVRMLALEGDDTGAGEDAALARIARRELAQGFDLARPSLQRVLLVQRGDGAHQLIWTFHHVLLDGWSSAKLIEEVLARYLGQAQAPRAGRFRDYVAWLAKQDARAVERFWRADSSRLEAPTLLASTVPPPAADEGHGRVSRVWSEAGSERIRRFAQREHVTVNTLVQAAWVLLLQRYTGQRAVAFGATVSGRPPTLAGAESMLGLFINSLPVIQAPRAGERVGPYLRALQAHNLSLREVEHSPLYDVQRWAGRAGQALFDTLLVFENYPVDRALRARSGSALGFSEVASVERTNYALTVEASSEGTVALHYGFDTSRFERGQVERIASQVDRLLATLCEDAARTLGGLSMIEPADAEQLVRRGALLRLPSARGLHALIEAQVRRTPNAIAVSTATDRLSYAELNARANQCARALVKQGVGPDRLVGLCVERGLSMVIGMLAILKAGGAYVPLDPDYPRERLSYLIRDSDITLLVTESALLPTLEGAPLALWHIDRELAAMRGVRGDDLAQRMRPQQLAYCIYTSGSTGRPKGVLLQHEGLINHMEWMRSTFPLGEGDVVLQKTSFGFDASVWEFWLPLLSGARLHVASAEVARDPAALVAEIDQQGVTVLQLVPQLLEAMLRVDGARAVLPGLRYLFSGGEALPPALLREVQALKPGLLTNLYGPTEATIDATHWRAGDASDAGVVPIGEPIANTQALILGPGLELLPEGVIGELWLSGQGLARGYHQRAGLTADRFAPNPYGAPGERLYRTGDLARYRAGAIEYAGRIDHQVKIRGHRIELGEIEERLRAHAALREVAVIARALSGAKQLVAYVVPEADATPPGEAELRAFLRESLPEHMLPARFVKLAALPLSVHGKLDRAALPEPERTEAPYVAPETPYASQLAAIWQGVLAIERVGMADNFFELGGDSVLAMQVIAEINAVMHINVPLRALFEARTLADFERALIEVGQSFARTGE
ncbi:MAG: amino acid adenylation domain-containing protein, partial [Polyangiales bacterium]